MAIRTRGEFVCASWIARAAATAEVASRKAVENSSPWQSISSPPCSATAARTMRRCSSRAPGYRSPSDCTRPVEPSMSVKRRVTPMERVYDDALRCNRLAVGARGGVRVRMLENIHRVLRSRRQLEPVAVLPIVDDDAELIGPAVPVERDGDAVALAICQFLFHAASLPHAGLRRHAATQLRAVRVPVLLRAGWLRRCESPGRAGSRRGGGRRGPRRDLRGRGGPFRLPGWRPRRRRRRPRP